MLTILSRRVAFRAATLLAAASALACTSDGPGTEPGAIALVIQPINATVQAGGTTSAAVTLTRSGAFTGPVTLTVIGVPVGITGAVSNQQTTGLVTTAVVTLTVAAVTTPGSYTLVLHGAGSGVPITMATFVLIVTAGPPALPAPCVPGTMCDQWGANATASTEYSSTYWSAGQATGPPNVTGCEDDVLAWASLNSTGKDWLELEYPVSVRPTEIRVYESLAVSSIVKVEVKDGSGTYHTVYAGLPGNFTCPRVLTIPVTGVSVAVKVVRVSVDQSVRGDWNEIDAVRLTGVP